MSKEIIIDGVALIGEEGIDERREDFSTFMLNVNGCGAGNARFDFVPDTMYGLSVKPVCNLHDDAWTFCPATREAFDQANKEFHSNLKTWINAKSSKILKFNRFGRLWVYYKMVCWFGWPSFVDCKKKLGQTIES